MTDNQRVRGPTGSERLVAQQRKKKSRLFAVPVSENDLGERIMVGATPQSIGAELRAARLARGESTADVAQQLRLRESYIEAIETGNFKALPGVTYAIGFLRSYARYLRLDAEDLVQRFKEEVSDIAPATDLAFFEPVSESRVPRGGLVVLAVFLAVAAYAGWYYLSTRDITVADMVPAVPEELSGMIGSPEKAESPLPPSATEQAGQDQQNLMPPGPQGETDAAAAADVDSAPPPPEQIAPAQTASERAPGAESTAAAPVPAAPEAGGTAPAAPSTATPPAATRSVTPPTTAAAPTIPAVPPVARAPDTATQSDAVGGGVAWEGARVYGEGNIGSRITVRATADSWIQVRAADDSLLMTRTLRPGDSYRVPNQSGLKLMTGNAGALEIVVDGQIVPSIGPLGAVKRNVALDAERLKAGTAAN